LLGQNFSISFFLKIPKMNPMNSHRIGYYIAYTLLVAGTFLALVLSPRPLSGTIVTLALFSFNLAAIIFILPQVLELIGNLKNDAPSTQELSLLRSTLERLAQKMDTPSPAPLSSDQAAPTAIPLSSVLPEAPKHEPAPAAQGMEKDFEELLGAEESFPSQDNAPPAASLGTPPVQMGIFVETARSVQPASSVKSPAEPPAVTGPSADQIRLLVHAAIPEDSVLCLRGEGAGLDWQEGVPMTYQENNLWSFEGTSATPVTCQIYLNDEIAAFGDDLTLVPGETLETSPCFPPVDAS
jgi:hypothetical protein